MFDFQNKSFSPAPQSNSDEDEPVYKLESIDSARLIDDSVFDSLTGWHNQPRPQVVSMDSVGGVSSGRPDSASTTHSDIEDSPAVVVDSFREVPVSTEVDVRMSGDNSSTVQTLEVSKIFPNPYQPRKYFDPAALQELSNSIKEHGVIQPVVVTQTPVGYELVVGERRFRASVLAGLTHVPAIVKRGMTDLTKLEVALIENIQRHELNPIEEAHAYDRLVKGFGMTQEQIAKKLGKSRPAVTNTLRLLNLPVEIQRAIMENKLAEGHARPLLSIADRTQQLTLFKEILDKGLNTRQIEARAREIVQRKSVDGLAPDPKLLAMESELRGRVGAPVKIQRQGRGGKILIEFYSEEELEDIIRRMADENFVGPAQSSSMFLTV